MDRLIALLHAVSRAWPYCQGRLAVNSDLVNVTLAQLAIQLRLLTMLLNVAFSSSFVHCFHSPAVKFAIEPFAL
jgi:hypothetical protein